MKTREEEFDVVQFMKNSGFLSMDKTISEISKKGGFKTEHDDFFFNLKFDDKEEVSTAIIRFMPNGLPVEKMKELKEKNEKPVHIIELRYHWFMMRNGRYLKEPCPVQNSKPCPICEAINPLYDTDNDRYWKMAKKRTRICNILVLKNHNEPEKEKQVFLFKLPDDVRNMIFQRIPQDDSRLGKQNESSGELYFNPFNPFNSAYFKLKAFKEEKNIFGSKKKSTNYSGSSFFEEIKPMDEKVFKKLWEKCWNLEEIFEWPEYVPKSYEELKKKFDDGMGTKLIVPGVDKGDMTTIENEVDGVIEEGFDDEALKKEIEDGGMNLDDMNDLDKDIVEELKDDNEKADDEINLDEYLK